MGLVADKIKNQIKIFMHEELGLDPKMLLRALFSPSLCLHNETLLRQTKVTLDFMQSYCLSGGGGRAVAVVMIQIHIMAASSSDAGAAPHRMLTAARDHGGCQISSRRHNNPWKH